MNGCQARYTKIRGHQAKVCLGFRAVELNDCFEGFSTDYLLKYPRLKFVTIKEPGCDSIAVEDPPFKSVDGLWDISNAITGLKV